MRLLGFVSGLTLGGLGLLILVNPPLAMRARDVVVASLREPLSPVIREAPPAPSPTAPAPGEAPAVSTLESPPDATPGPENRTALADTRAPDVDVPRHQPGSDVAENRAEPASEPRQWYAVWSPFLTARAARGFADRLGTLTGLEFTVIEIDQRKHQVAFAYIDAEQRDTALAMIEGQTGLKLEEAR